ncbi:MAG: type II toxin-antitoxin system ParD family antitoxin [Planctomycetaceae bacterium]
MSLNIPASFTDFVSQAVAAGRYSSEEEVVAEALQLLRDRIAAKSGSVPETHDADELPDASVVTADWKDRLRHWVDSHPRQTHEVDVSRESIY